MVTVVPITDEHAAAVLEIYRLGIATGNATFETEPPDWGAFRSTRLPGQMYAAVDGDQVRGWVACARVSTRAAYAGVVEHSVYVHPSAGGRGIGRALLERLITSTEAAGIWTIQSGIFPENAASLSLHRSCGFRVVGTREKVGRGDGGWRDVVLLERRSPHIL